MSCHFISLIQKLFYGYHWHDNNRSSYIHIKSKKVKENEKIDALNFLYF